MDEKEAAWLAGLIRDASWQTDSGALVTIEVVDDSTHWLQVLPVGSAEGGIEHYLLNFPYRGSEGDPIQTLGQVGLMLPPATESSAWEDDGFATVKLHPDTPLVAIAFLINDLFQKLMNVPNDRGLSVQIEYGFKD